MKLVNLVNRKQPPEPWSEGEKIPWDDPEFSRRMLDEHLSQAHDAASRRSEKIAAQVDWIQHHLLPAKGARILDLGCGPGLYTSRFAEIGHECIGIDFSPASIKHARSQASSRHLACTYVHGDVRKVDYGVDYDLAMFIFGELNVFRPMDARLILQKIYAALKPGGRLLLEPHTFYGVQKLGQAEASWYSTPSGLFSDRPHVYLQENFWDAECSAATTRFFIIDAETSEVTPCTMSMQAYQQSDYESLLTSCGFRNIEFQAQFGSETVNAESYLQAITAVKLP